MRDVNRRKFLEAAAAIGASLAWSGAAASRSRTAWRERRELFPEGVASGDPTADSVLLWTRCPGDAAVPLRAEIAEDPDFVRVVATAPAMATAASDWTTRVLVAGLKPAREYWYRFTRADGAGSRIGRTLTAPANDDPRAVHFAFVSCQNVNYGAQNAWRRMIFEDERAAPADRLGFVLHLGDFIYELVWYPEDRPKGMYDRRITEILRFVRGEKVSDFHVPLDVDDYRAVYRAYLRDPDIQDARARWPFVTMWDNHEFSWMGWQSFAKLGGKTFPAQSRKVAANQAWFEYQTARVPKPGADATIFDAPQVENAAITAFDDHGLGQEPNNLTAIDSLRAYRAIRWGRHVELIVTDEHSFRSEEPSGRDEAKPFSSDAFPELVPQEAMEIWDAGKAWPGGAPATIRHDGADLPNFQREAPPQTVLGARQKTWFLDRLKRSRATWKIWGSTLGTLDWRADPQNLPLGLTRPWPGAGYAIFGGGGDHGTAWVERGDIYDFVAKNRITGFATVAGDRHSFWAGFSAKALPPARFEPVGVAFVTGSISAPGLVESFEYGFPKQHPLRPLFLVDRPGSERPEPSVNLLLRHGVRTCLDYAAHGDLDRAKAVSNPDNAPHLRFLDLGGHGYAVVRADGKAIETTFVCIPRPITRSATPDGGPVRYRVIHRAPLWRPGEPPRLEQRLVEGDAGLSL
ncbi:MAG: alkaline phosphatase D family protein [Sphingomonas sp.]|jgi:alkaline phosphatase D|uniref:alkaline phosphatase D family protein n=1 Tax=Sphingomonas sp. TaxID=28214 RepID=UPI00356480E7